MFRTLIALLHTVLGLLTATGAAWYVTLAVAAIRWESAFDGTTWATWLDLAIAGVALLAACLHVAGAWATFLGAAWGVRILIAWTLVHAWLTPQLLQHGLGWPAWLAMGVMVPVLMSTLVAWADQLVLHHRRQQRDLQQPAVPPRPAALSTPGDEHPAARPMSMPRPTEEVEDEPMSPPPEPPPPRDHSVEE